MTGSDFNLCVGVVGPIDTRGTLSGIAKTVVSGPVELSKVGFAGDQQGDTIKHGGPEKALHHYPLEHYAVWRTGIGHHPLLASPGAFGENISATGLTEDTVSIGDVFTLGTAIVEVSQGRQPCWRLNQRFGHRTMAREMQTSGRTGWYYRVHETGVVKPEDRLVRVNRTTPEWTLARIWRLFYVDPLNRVELEQIACLDRLASGWRDYATRRLESNTVEDWSKRLNGPSGTEGTLP